VKTQLDAGYWLAYGRYLAATSQQSDRNEDPFADAKTRLDPTYWRTYGAHLAAMS